MNTFYSSNSTKRHSLPRRALAFFLAFILAFSLLPLNALADQFAKAEFNGANNNDPNFSLNEKFPNKTAEEHSFRHSGNDVTYNFSKAASWQSEEEYRAFVDLEASSEGANLRIEYDIVMVFDSSGSMWAGEHWPDERSSAAARVQGALAGFREVYEQLLELPGEHNIGLVDFASLSNGETSDTYNLTGQRGGQLLSYDTRGGYHFIAPGGGVGPTQPNVPLTRVSPSNSQAAYDWAYGVYTDQYSTGNGGYTNWEAAIESVNSLFQSRFSSNTYYEIYDENTIRVPVLLFFTDGTPSTSQGVTLTSKMIQDTYHAGDENHLATNDGTTITPAVISTGTLTSLSFVAGDTVWLMGDESNENLYASQAASRAQLLINNDVQFYLALCGVEREKEAVNIMNSAFSGVKYRELFDSARAVVSKDDGSDLGVVFGDLMNELLNINVVRIEDTISNKWDIDFDYAQKELGWIPVNRASNGSIVAESRYIDNGGNPGVLTFYTGVTNNGVGARVGAAYSDGVQKITVTKNSDGSWRVIFDITSSSVDLGSGTVEYVSSRIPIILKEEYQTVGTFVETNKIVTGSTPDVASVNFVIHEEMNVSNLTLYTEEVYLPVGIDVAIIKEDAPNYVSDKDELTYSLMYANNTNWEYITGAPGVREQSQTVKISDILPSPLNAGMVVDWEILIYDRADVVYHTEQFDSTRTSELSGNKLINYYNYLGATVKPGATRPAPTYTMAAPGVVAYSGSGTSLSWDKIPLAAGQLAVVEVTLKMPVGISQDTVWPASNQTDTKTIMERLRDIEGYGSSKAWEYTYTSSSTSPAPNLKFIENTASVTAANSFDGKSISADTTDILHLKDGASYV